MVLKGILEGIGDVQVIEAEDGLKAWEILDGGLLPGLCFLDINMPRMNGLELLKRIRGDKRMAGLKVCFCSAVRDRQIIVQAAAFQPDYYILKPFSRNTIQAQVQKARGVMSQTQSLDPAEVVCTRLGIDMDSYLAMVGCLLEELTKLVTKIPTLLTQMDIAGATLALDGARSAAQTLGAHSIFNLADSLTRLVKSSGAGAGYGHDSKDEMNAHLPQWLACSTDQLFQIMQDMRGELRNIEHLATTASRSHKEAKANSESNRSRVQSEMDALTRFLTEVFQRGKLLATAKNVRSKSLNVPIKASFLGEQSAETRGSLTRKTSFSMAVLDDETAKAIEECRSITDLVKLLSFPLEGGARWIPEASIRLLESELACRNDQGVMLLRQAIGDNFEVFIRKKEELIRDNLLQMFPQASGQNKELEKRLQEILAEIRARFQPALDGELTTHPLFSPLDIGDLTNAADSARWAAPYSLLYRAARLFRDAATDRSFGRVFRFSTFDQQGFLHAMDVFGDRMAYEPDSERAQRELQQLEEIAASQVNFREKCYRVWRLLRGDSVAGASPETAPPPPQASPSANPANPVPPA